MQLKGCVTDAFTTKASSLEKPTNRRWTLQNFWVNLFGNCKLSVSDISTENEACRAPGYAKF